MRVLALHGYTQNSHILSKRLGAIRKACGNDAEFVFLDAPIVLLPADLEFFGTKNLDPSQKEANTEDETLVPRAWWRANDTNTKYLGFQDTLNYIRDFLASQERPFQGILGFSQGSGMAALLASLLERPTEAAKFDFLVDGKMPHQPFEFGVLVSGFLPRDLDLARLLTESTTDDKPVGLNTRCLHIVGRGDTVVAPESTLKFIAHCRKSRVEFHPGGHFIPATAAWRAFLKAYFTAWDDEEAAATIPPPSATGAGSAPGSGAATPVRTGTPGFKA